MTSSSTDVVVTLSIHPLPYNHDASRTHSTQDHTACLCAARKILWRRYQRQARAEWGKAKQQHWLAGGLAGCWPWALSLTVQCKSRPHTCRQAGTHHTACRPTARHSFHVQIGKKREGDGRHTHTLLMGADDDPENGGTERQERRHWRPVL